MHRTLFIWIGLGLYFFLPFGSFAADPIACEADYIVQPGDWLSKIATETYGRADIYEAIVLATNLQAEVDDDYPLIDNINALEVGWQLCLPNEADLPVLLAELDATPKSSLTAVNVSTTDWLITNGRVPELVVPVDIAQLPTEDNGESLTDTEARQATGAVVSAPPALPAPATSPPPATTNTAFDYGIQLDPDGNPQANIQHIQTLGLGWIKMQMPWKNVEPNPGNMQWSHWDQRIGAYHGAGLKVLLSIPKAPDWARPADDDKSVEGPPIDPQTYANFVAQVAARYAGQVQAIEVWNEQNLYYEAGGEGRVNVDNYMALLQAAHGAIKGANPGMLVISGAPTPTGAPYPYAVDDVVYLRQMYERGLRWYADGVGIHPSGFANPPDVLYGGGDYDPNRGYDDHRSFFFRNTMEAYRQLMLEFGHADAALWPTEYGWPVWRYWGDERFVFAQENSLEEQANYIRRAFEMGRDWGWVGPMFLWNLDYAVTNPNSEMANFSILTQNGPTPAYEAIRLMPK